MHLKVCYEGRVHFKCSYHNKEKKWKQSHSEKERKACSQGNVDSKPNLPLISNVNLAS